MNDAAALDRLTALDLNLILALHHLLATGSVTDAAGRLRITQPAASNALARLRVVFDDPLLVRTGRVLTPTPRAQALKPRVEAAVEALAQVVGARREFDPRRCDEELTLACGDDAQLADVPNLVARLASELPKARLRVVSLDYLLATDGLARGTVDVALGPPEAAPRGGRRRVVRRDDAVLVMRQGHPGLRAGRRMDWLKDAEHVSPYLTLGEPGRVGREHASRLRTLGHQIRTSVAVPGFAAAAMVVLASDLVTGMPAHLARSLAARLPLAIVAHPTGAGLVTTALLWHERTHADPARAAFRRLLAESLGSAPHPGRRTRRTP